jgi:hypothetical protein
MIKYLTNSANEFASEIQTACFYVASMFVFLRRASRCKSLLMPENITSPNPTPHSKWDDSTISSHKLKIESLRGSQSSQIPQHGYPRAA